jgi:hypothetical protein
MGCLKLTYQDNNNHLKVMYSNVFATENNAQRFLSIDNYTKKYPNNSPYIFASNSPILYVDENGDYSVARHFIITYKAAIKLGYSKAFAIKIAHYASVYADHPDYNYKDEATGITSGEFNRKEMEYEGMGDMTIHLRYDTKKYGTYDDTKESQGSTKISTVTIHGMKAYWETISDEEAVKRALDGGTFEIENGPYKGAIVKIEGANNVVKRLSGKGEDLTQKEMKELGLAIHTIQDAVVHKGKRWVTDEDKDAADKLNHENDHPNLDCLGGHGVAKAITNTIKALKKIKEPKK